MFLNHKSILVTDSQNNLFNYIWKDNEIIEIYFDGKSDKVIKNVIHKDCTDQFDVEIDNSDKIYIVFQKNDGTILLGSSAEDNWEFETISDEFEAKIFNINLFKIYEELHFMYCVHSFDDTNYYRLYHHILDNDWVSLDVVDFTVNNILNPFQIVVTDNEMLLAYYDLNGTNEQIYIKVFDILSRVWNKEILVTENEKKLYLDMILTEDNMLHITYSKLRDFNYIVNYEKYKYEDNMIQKISNTEISSPANCTYPTLVKYNNKLWNIWTEYDYIASCFSEDMGLTWSNPFMWKISKKENFVRYKYKSNSSIESNNYNLNFSFGKEHPQYTFVGFGPLRNSVEIPIKK